MKRRTDRLRAAAPRSPREIRVRMTSPRPAGTAAPDVWVVNGRVIRFLDPSRPEEIAVDRTARQRMSGLLHALRPHRRRRLTVG